MPVECFLCLELSEEFVNCVNSRSEKWKERNIEGLVEKHLLPMAVLKSKSPWLCTTCWKILHDFHQFYKRIEHIHSFYDRLVKPEDIEIGEYEILNRCQPDELNGYDPIGEADISNDVSDNERVDCYECKYCCKNLTNRQVALNHMSWHEGNVYQCNICDLKYFDNEKFLNHKINHKQQQKSQSSCSDFTFKGFSSGAASIGKQKAVLQSDRRDVNLQNFTCKHCGKVLKEKHTFLNHIAWHEGNVYYCEICDLKFLNKSRFSKHKLSHASTEKRAHHDYGNFHNDNGSISIEKPEYNAGICQRSSMKPLSKLKILKRKFSGKLSITKKMNSYFYRGYFQCKHCLKMLKKEQDLLNHIAWHEGNIYRCNLCDLKILNDYKFKSHQMAHLGRNTSQFHPSYEIKEEQYPSQTADKNTSKRAHRYDNNLPTPETKEGDLNSPAEITKDRLRCKQCATTFAEERTLSNHIAWHEGNMFCCDICDLKFVDKLKFDNHKNSHNWKTYQVSDCDGVIDDNGPAGEDHRVDNNFNRVDNNFNTESLIVYESETELGQEESNKPDNDNGLSNNIYYKCNYCFETLHEEKVFLNHISWHEGKIFQCSVCELKFFDESKFEDHNALHESEQTQDCEDDNGGDCNRDDNISGDYLYCKICCKVLNERRVFLNHVSWHSGNIHQCEICDLKFVDKSTFDCHSRTHLPKSRFTCSECDKSFAFNYLLKLHQEKMHLNKHVNLCHVCGEYYRCRKSFLRHMLKHKGGVIPKEPCDICGRVLSGKDSLKFHKITQHPKDGIYAYICNICLKSFATQSLLNRHIRSAHIEGDGHKCSICDKMFKEMNRLKDHMLTHASEPQVKCPWCPEAFFSSGKLSIHRKKDHPKEYKEWKSNQYVEKLPA